MATSPIRQAEPPPVPPPDPQPPTLEEVGRLTAEAFRLDPDWDALVWLTMVTGARRGELCALRWRHVDLDRDVVTSWGQCGCRQQLHTNHGRSSRFEISQTVSSQDLGQRLRSVQLGVGALDGSATAD